MNIVRDESIFACLHPVKENADEEEEGIWKLLELSLVKTLCMC